MADLKMPEMNTVMIVGNLTKDPMYRTTSNNTPVVNFCIASNRRYRDRYNNWQEDVCYVGIVAWNRLAESCHERLKKGSAVLIEGELVVDEKTGGPRVYTRKDGTTGASFEVRANTVRFLTPKSQSADNGAAAASPSHVAAESAPMSEEDLPF